MNKTLQSWAHQARNPRNCETSWWHENANSIDVYCYERGRGGMSCRIDRKAIEGWLKRANSKKGKHK